jgi:hypothetical protein
MVGAGLVVAAGLKRQNAPVSNGKQTKVFGMVLQSGKTEE